MPLLAFRWVYVPMKTKYLLPAASAAVAAAPSVTAGRASDARKRHLIFGVMSVPRIGERQGALCRVGERAATVFWIFRTAWITIAARAAHTRRSLSHESNLDHRRRRSRGPDRLNRGPTAERQGRAAARRLTGGQIRSHRHLPAER